MKMKHFLAELLGVVNLGQHTQLVVRLLKNPIKKHPASHGLSQPQRFKATSHYVDSESFGDTPVEETNPTVGWPLLCDVVV